VRASFGRFGDTVAFAATDDDLVDWALDDLQTITGFDGRAAGLEEIYVQRWLGGLPRFDEAHLATVAEVRRLTSRRAKGRRRFRSPVPGPAASAFRQ